VCVCVCVCVCARALNLINQHSQCLGTVPDLGGGGVLNGYPLFSILFGTAEDPHTRWFICCSEAVSPWLFGDSKKIESKRSFP
jgi:hypothetical protein